MCAIMLYPLLAALFLLPPLLLMINKSRKILTSGRHEQQQPLLPPTLPRLPILGNLHQLSSLPHRSFAALSRKHGPLMLLYLGQSPTLIVSSADAAKEILKTYDHIFASRPPMKAARITFYGQGDIIFSPYCERWRHLRKLCVTRLLSAKMVQSFHVIPQKEVESMVSEISSMSLSGVAINMSETLNVFTCKLMCRTLFGDYFRDEGRFKVICKLVEELAEILTRFNVADCIPSLGWLDKFTGFNARATRISREWDALLEEIIKEHARDDDVCDIGKDKQDFVDVLLGLHKDEDNMEFQLSRIDIKATLIDMIAAGSDTSFLSLEWGMAELVRNPGSMKKLQEEVRGIADAGSTIREEHLSKMVYLKAVIKEIFRLHPPLPTLIPRESMDHCILRGYEIPKQTRVLINAWAIGRDLNHWETPNEFCPERFLGSAIEYKGHDFELIPFGAGRRMCPGMHFASYTLELAFANLVNKFNWELPDGMKCEDLDMIESPGIATRRRQRLYLVAKPS